jgi:SAM-dependent methyltransferase
MTALDHYENHLAGFYSWMFGDFDSMVERQKALLKGVHQFEAGEKVPVAIDLGCGSGFQSIALKQLGYDVHAVDFSSSLLQELRNKDASISVYCQDMCDLSFATHLHTQLVVCMGDTLTHLPSKEQVVQMFQAVHQTLAPQHGTFVISYRDLSGLRNELDRFIPVKSDNSRILTCFLEDEGPEHVKVFDLLYEKANENEAWELKKSFYVKLKLPVEWVKVQLESIGFAVTASTLPSGLVVVVATCRQQ